jgi:hypothetical protein
LQSSILLLGLHPHLSTAGVLQLDEIVVYEHSFPIDHTRALFLQIDAAYVEHLNSSHAADSRVWVLVLNEAHVERDVVRTIALNDFETNRVVPIFGWHTSTSHHISYVVGHEAGAFVVFAIVELESESDTNCTSEWNSKILDFITVRIEILLERSRIVPFSSLSARTDANLHRRICALESIWMTRADDCVVMIPISDVVRGEDVL